MPADKQEFEFYRNPRGTLSCQGKISYRGPVSSTHALPRIKLDLTADERVVLPPIQTQIFHPYSDAPEEGIEVLAYDYVEAFAEKFRALAERTRPRDLYDVVNLYRNTDARPEPVQFIGVLREKCAFKGIQLPRLIDLEPHRADLEAGWIHMLDHQLPALLPVKAFWDALPEIFDWLHGQVAPALAAMPMAAGKTLIRERIISFPTGSRAQSLIEIVRFAAANRLVVDLDYRDKAGNRSKRAIEAYSLRRSKEDDILLMAVHADDAQSRSYRIDRILGVAVTQRSFSPRYPIELTPSGPHSIPPISNMSGIATIRRQSGSRTPVFRAASQGPIYVFRCTGCGKLFERKTQDGTLRLHKNNAGRDCNGTYGTYVRTKY